MNNTAPLIDFPAASLESERAEIVAHYGKAAEQLIAIGQRLASLQRRLKHGEFSAFLDSLPFSHKSAYNFMRLAEHSNRVTVTGMNVTIAAWYITPPSNTELVDKIMAKAQAGEKVTVNEVKRILSSVNVQDDRLAYALHSAAEESPQLIAESLARGAMPTVQGLDMPLDEITATDVAWANEQDKWERKERQKLHIEENSPSQKWTIEITSPEAQKAIQSLLPSGMKAPAIGQTVTMLWKKEAE